MREEETNKQQQQQQGQQSYNKAPDGRGGIREVSRKTQTHHRMWNEDLGLVAIGLLLHFLSRDRLEADLHHGSASRFRPPRRVRKVPSPFAACGLQELHARVFVRGEMRRRLLLRLVESSSNSWAASPHCFCLDLPEVGFFFFFFACFA